MPVLSWFKVQNQGTLYSPRTGHDCLFYKDKIYLFAGTDDDDRKNDIFAYDVILNKWSRLPPGGQPPNPRSGAKGVPFRNALYFFGGY